MTSGDDSPWVQRSGISPRRGRLKSGLTCRPEITTSGFRIVSVLVTLFATWLEGRQVGVMSRLSVGLTDFKR